MTKGTFEIKQGTVNVSGNAGSAFRTAADTTLKFTANDFNGTAKMFSTFNVTNKAEINGNVTVDMNNYFNGDVIYVTGDLTQMLIDAKTLANFTESSLKDCVLLPDWKVQASNDSSDLVLKYTGSVTEVGSLQDFDGGWVKLNGDADSEIDFTMEYTNDLGTAETFVDWLNATAEIQGYEGTVTLSETALNSIVFSDLLLDANGMGHLYLDYGAYNSYHHEAFPEPSTWAMLIIGVGALVLARRKR
ncbi:MAG: PEP-CTERM sorting domain-containing protein [Planctomycetia bacterium]|nr:PEP-CTERM sorting domain-containing protein [Planctomycetia bacterium]